NRALAQQRGAETMNGADVRLFELQDGGIQPHGFVRRPVRMRASPLELLAQAQLELTGALRAEGDRHDLGDARSARLDHPYDSLDELGGLPRAGRGFDNQRVV